MFQGKHVYEIILCLYDIVQMKTNATWMEKIWVSRPC